MWLQVGESDLEAATFSEADRKRLFSGTSGILALMGLGGDSEEEEAEDLKRLDSGRRKRVS